MSLIGNVYGSWTIIEEPKERTLGRLMVVGRCICGTIRSMSKSPFIHGGNSTKCFRCHLKNQKIVPMTRQRQN